MTWTLGLRAVEVPDRVDAPARAPPSGRRDRLRALREVAERAVEVAALGDLERDAADRSSGGRGPGAGSRRRPPACGCGRRRWGLRPVRAAERPGAAARGWIHDWPRSGHFVDAWSRARYADATAGAAGRTVSGLAVHDPALRRRGPGRLAGAPALARGAVPGHIPGP